MLYHKEIRALIDMTRTITMSGKNDNYGCWAHIWWVSFLSKKFCPKGVMEKKNE